jgi:hypothetical protein
MEANMRMLLTVALVLAAPVAYASEPLRLAQASGGLDAAPSKPAEQRSLTLEPADPMNLKMDPVEPPKSAETKASEQTKAAERAPVEAKSTETKPAESKSADIKPDDAAPGQAKKKPVAKRRETDEEKARRIARRYGVTW